MELFKAQNVASKIITKQEISKLKFLYQKQQERIEKDFNILKRVLILVIEMDMEMDIILQN